MKTTRNEDRRNAEPQHIRDIIAEIMDDLKAKMKERTETSDNE